MGRRTLSLVRVEKLQAFELEELRTDANPGEAWVANVDEDGLAPVELVFWPELGKFTMLWLGELVTVETTDLEATIRHILAIPPPLAPHELN